MSRELDYARKLVGEAIHAPGHYLDVITLACALTYRIDDVFSAPRILALGEKGSGKSTLLMVASYLAANAGAVTAVIAMTAPSYVADFRMNRRHTPLLDEINQLFGEAGGNGKFSKFYAYLNQGYRRDTAYAQYQENRVPLQIPVFGVVFAAGRGLAAPPDLRERSILLKMERAPGSVQVSDFSDPQVRAGFRHAARSLESWARALPPLDTTRARGLHPELAHRLMDVWGPLFAVAQAAGDVWVKRLLLAFECIELDAGIPVYPPDAQLLLDYLRFTELTDADEGVASGEFARWANEQEHGAYLSKKPGQFKQFACDILGSTASFYDAGLGRTKRGWNGTVHLMNLDNARRLIKEIEAQKNAASPEAITEWEDF